MRTSEQEICRFLHWNVLLKLCTPALWQHPQDSRIASFAPSKIAKIYDWQCYPQFASEDSFWGAQAQHVHNNQSSKPHTVEDKTVFNVNIIVPQFVVLQMWMIRYNYTSTRQISQRKKSHLSDQIQSEFYPHRNDCTTSRLIEPCYYLSLHGWSFPLLPLYENRCVCVWVCIHVGLDQRRGDNHCAVRWKLLRRQHLSHTGGAGVSKMNRN